MTTHQTELPRRSVSIDELDFNQPPRDANTKPCLSEQRIVMSSEKNTKNKNYQLSPHYDEEQMMVAYDNDEKIQNVISTDDSSSAIPSPSSSTCDVSRPSPFKSQIDVHTMVHKMIAEALGTFILVFFGCGSICALVYTESLAGLGQSCIIWSFGAFLAIQCVGMISGAHLNPAVSLSFALLRSDEFHPIQFGCYYLAQVIGAIMAGAVNLGLYHVAISRWEENNDIMRGAPNSNMSAVGFGAYWNPEYVGGASQALLIEMVGTAILVFVIFAVTNANNNVPKAAVPAIVGVAYGAVIAVIGSLSGGGINPARDFGPRLITMMAGWGTTSMEGVWVYTLGPFVGGPLGALLADKMYSYVRVVVKRGVKELEEDLEMIANVKRPVGGATAEKNVAIYQKRDIFVPERE